MLNIISHVISYGGNGNQTHNEIPFVFTTVARIKNINDANNKDWCRCGEMGTLLVGM